MKVLYFLLSTHFLFTILTCAHRMRVHFCPQQHWLLCHLGLYSSSSSSLSALKRSRRCSVSWARQAKNLRFSSGVTLVSHRGGRSCDLPMSKGTSVTSFSKLARSCASCPSRKGDCHSPVVHETEVPQVPLERSVNGLVRAELETRPVVKLGRKRVEFNHSTWRQIKV